MIIDSLKYGYPNSCNKCDQLPGDLKLQVSPFYKEGNIFKLMLVGQDPTIFKDSSRVRKVLMLDEESGQLNRWLRNIFKNNFDEITIYATNIVKCTFNNPPSTNGGVNYLKPYFEYCKSYLGNEIKNYRPNLVIALGEPAHILIRTLFTNSNNIGQTMQLAFNGNFIKAKVDDVEFDYSPCLHIKTFRVAEVYGKSVNIFKESLIKYFVK